MTFEEHAAAIGRARDEFNAAVEAAREYGVRVDYEKWSCSAGKITGTTKLGVITLSRSMT